jgi:hypothetical protein
VPEPKSGCIGDDGPMVFTQVAELGETGSWSMRVFQMLSAGRTVQFPIVGAWAAAALATLKTTKVRKIIGAITFSRRYQNRSARLYKQSGKRLRSVCAHLTRKFTSAPHREPASNG